MQIATPVDTAVAGSVGRSIAGALTGDPQRKNH